MLFYHRHCLLWLMTCSPCPHLPNHKSWLHPCLNSQNAYPNPRTCYTVSFGSQITTAPLGSYVALMWHATRTWHGIILTDKWDPFKIFLFSFFSSFFFFLLLSLWPEKKKGKKKEEWEENKKEKKKSKRNEKKKEKDMSRPCGMPHQRHVES